MHSTLTWPVHELRTGDSTDVILATVVIDNSMGFDSSSLAPMLDGLA